MYSGLSRGRPLGGRRHGTTADERESGSEGTAMAQCASMGWNPQQYLKFGGERLRPAHDLLTRVTLEAPGHIVDLGCGTGAVTALLSAPCPDPRILALDNPHPILPRPPLN